MDIPYETTIITFNFEFTNEPGLTKVSFRYYDEAINKEVYNNMLPDELYMLSSSDLAVVAYRNHFDKGVFRI